MTSTEKWNEVQTYLNGLRQRVLSNLKTSAVGETPNELRAFGAQLALIEDILAQVERLDRDEKIDVGRPAPPKQVHKY